MVEALEKQMTELNDLVRGCTESSEAARTELQEAVGRFDEQKKATEQLQADLEALGKDFRSTTKKISTRVGHDSNYTGSFKSRDHAYAFGVAILGYCGGQQRCVEMLKEMELEEQLKRDMSTTDGASGGFLVAPTFAESIIRLVEAYGVFRRNVTTVPMESDNAIWNKRTGGLSVYCPGEGVDATKSDISLGNVSLQAKKWMTLTAISNELSEDSAVAVAELVADEIALAFAQKEDQVGFLGDGTQPYFRHTGILGHSDTTSYGCDDGDSTFAESCKYKYLTGVIGQIPTWAYLMARYYFHRSVFWQHVVGLVDSNGQPVVKFNAGGVGAGSPLQLGAGTPFLMGFPVEFVDCLPSVDDDAVSTAAWLYGSIKRAWMMGNVGRMRIDHSDQHLFSSDQIAIRGAQRVAFSAADATGVAKVVTAAS